ELLAVEPDRVEVELGERLARLPLEDGARVDAGAPRVIHAGRVVGDVAAAVRRHDLELRELFEDAVEHEVADRHGGVERVTDDVDEVVIREPLTAGEAV